MASVGRSSLIALVVLFGLIFGLAIPTDKKHASRILKKQLSDEEHYSDDHHNKDFDHEAFLGSEDEADEFDFLSPEESKSRLAIIVERIDLNHDGNITESELKEWIQQSQRRYIVEDVDKQWQVHTHNDDSVKTLTWQQFRNKTYGFLDEIPNSNRSPDDMKTYVDMLK